MSTSLKTSNYRCVHYFAVIFYLVKRDCCSSLQYMNSNIRYRSKSDNTYQYPNVTIFILFRALRITQYSILRIMWRAWFVEIYNFVNHFENADIFHFLRFSSIKTVKKLKNIFKLFNVLHELLLLARYFNKMLFWVLIRKHISLSSLMSCQLVEVIHLSIWKIIIWDLKNCR